MLGKLMKYEFKYYFKLLTPFYIFTLFSGLIIKLCSIIMKNAPILNIPLSMVIFISVLAIMFLPFYAFAVSIKRFYTTVVKDEGYLTNTLPVKKSSIVLSKLFTSTIASVLAGAVSIISVLIVANTETNVFKPLIDGFVEFYKYDALLVYLIPLYGLVSYIFVVLVIYAAIAFGQKHNSKLKASIIYGVILYFINQLLVSFVVWVLDNISPNIMDKLEDKFPPKDLLNIFLTVFILVYILVCFVYYKITTYNLNKNLNLE